jgi:hypothetical protein
MHTTPSLLSVKPIIMEMIVPEYSFEDQSRGTLMAGKYTGASIQTFDHKGSPKDSQSDQND